MNFWKVVLLTSVLLLCVNVLSADATTITFQNGLNGYSGTQDTYIYEGDPDCNYGDYYAMWAGIYNSRKYRSLIKFTDIFGPDANQIHYGSSIISATLCFRSNSYSNTVNTHLVTTSWDESDVTWKSFGVYTEDGGAAGDDWETPVISSQLVPYGYGLYVDFDVTSAVSAWSSGTDNNGLIFLGINHTMFYTEDHLPIEYRPLINSGV